MGTARRLTARLGGWLILAAVMLTALTVTAYALSRGTSPPPKRPLADAIQRALSAKPVSALHASFTITQHVIPGMSLSLGSKTIPTATGSVWANGSRVRVMLRSPLGSAQAAFDGRTLTVYDPAHRSAYVLTVPSQRTMSDPGRHTHEAPSLAQITQVLSRLGQFANVSSAVPGTIAGRPSYTVRVSARHDSGLIGPLAIAWDAAHGTPLRVALYPRGSGMPAIDIQVTHISYDRVSGRDLHLALPKSVRVTRVHLPSRSAIKAELQHVQKGSSVSAAVPVSAAAPASLAGLQRTTAHRVSTPHGTGLIAVYGHGLGAVILVEATTARQGSPRDAGSLLPSVDISGARASELRTTLGTIVSFTRGHTRYVLLGAHPASTILAAARSLR